MMGEVLQDQVVFDKMLGKLMLVRRFERSVDSAGSFLYSLCCIIQSKVT